MAHHIGTKKQEEKRYQKLRLQALIYALESSKIKIVEMFEDIIDYLKDAYEKL